MDSVNRQNRRPRTPPAPPTAPPTAPRAAAVLLAVLCAVPLAGCYTRTIEARGMGTQYRTGQTYKPNLKTSEEGGSLFDGAGDLLIGPRKIEQRRR